MRDAANNARISRLRVDTSLAIGPSTPKILERETMQKYNQDFSKLAGCIIAISDTEIVWVDRVQNGCIFCTDTEGKKHDIPLTRLGYGKKRKRAILAYLYEEKCARCGSTESLSIDHIRPRMSMGNDGLENLQLLCRKCNKKKDVDNTDYRVFNPRILFR